MPNIPAQSQPQVEEPLLALSLPQPQCDRMHVLPPEGLQVRGELDTTETPQIFLAAVCIAATVGYWFGYWL